MQNTVRKAYKYMVHAFALGDGRGDASGDALGDASGDDWDHASGNALGDTR